jgi:hypothetical protein
MSDLHKKRAGREAEVVECLPSKHEALSSNPKNLKKKKKRSPHNKTTKKQYDTDTKCTQSPVE